MSNDNVPLHSGSRWEPPASAEPGAGQTIPTAGLGSAPMAVDPAHRKGRRRRGLLLAVLAAVLTLGASTAGIAYVQDAQDPAANDPAAVADSPQDRGAVGERDDDRPRADHHHDGDRGVDGPGSRGEADGASGELPS